MHKTNFGAFTKDGRNAVLSSPPRRLAAGVITSWLTVGHLFTDEHEDWVLLVSVTSRIAMIKEILGGGLLFTALADAMANTKKRGQDAVIEVL